MRFISCCWTTHKSAADRSSSLTWTGEHIIQVLIISVQVELILLVAGATPCSLFCLLCQCSKWNFIYLLLILPNFAADNNKQELLFVTLERSVMWSHLLPSSRWLACKIWWCFKVVLQKLSASEAFLSSCCDDSWLLWRGALTASQLIRWIWLYIPVFISLSPFLFTFSFYFILFLALLQVSPCFTYFFLPTIKILSTFWSG